MNAGGRLAGFVTVVAVAFGAALVAGRAVGPVGEPSAAASGQHGKAHSGMDSHAESAGKEPDEVPGGLMTSQGGYTLDLAKTPFGSAASVPVSFTINGPDDSPVTAFDVEHDKLLHLIAVRRDFTGFQHLHPALDDGVWSSKLALTPGVWRLFADFTPKGGSALTLGADLSVPGQFDAAVPGPDARTDHVDGYTVTVDGDLAAGDESRLTMSVSKQGRPVTDLEPYLGAYGHLVVLKTGDLGYLHAHPDGTPGDGATEPGPDVVFHTSVPSAGSYHLYLDFKHGGVVRTASFTLPALNR